MTTNGLTLLAKVPDLDPITKDQCGYEIRQGVGGQVTKIPTEAVNPYFAQGFVSIEKPRDAAYSDDIVKATEGFALADAAGNVLAEFKTASEAEKARSGAKLRLEVSVPEAEKVAVASK